MMVNRVSLYNNVMGTPAMGTVDCRGTPVFFCVTLTIVSVSVLFAYAIFLKWGLAVSFQ